MSNYFEDILRSMTRHLATVVDAHHTDLAKQLDALDQALVDLDDDDLSRGDKEAALHRARRRLVDVRRSMKTLAVLTAGPQQPRSLDEVVAAADVLASGQRRSPLATRLLASVDGDRLPMVIDAGYQSQRLAGALLDVGTAEGRTEIRWSVKGPAVILEIGSGKSAMSGETAPVGRLEMTQIQATASGVMPKQAGLDVLVMDADSMIRTGLSRFLRREGHRVETATSVDEALLWIDRWRFDVLLSDVDATRSDGFVLHANLQRRAPELVDKLMFMSKRPTNVKVRRRTRLLGQPIIRKPFDEEKLLTQLWDVALSPTKGRSEGSGY